jgi:pyruvate/2-oxoglutarate dehydrogenase complex dihydrolipoamide acyltransferase (E2) component
MQGGLTVDNFDKPHLWYLRNITKCRKRSYLARLAALLLLAAGLCIPVGAQQTPAQKRQVDRLAILVDEHQHISRQLATENAKSPKNEENIKALIRSLDALNKEIAFVRSRPVQEQTWSGGQGKTGASLAQSKAAAPPPTAPMKYEEWDIFNNFGREGDREDKESVE